MKKQKVGILFGGMSAEHEVSIESAKALYSNLDKNKFSPLLLYINKKGKWCHFQEKTLLRAKSYRESISFQREVESAYPFYSFAPWDNPESPSIDCDIFFPVLHGPNGEDGKIQALLEISNKPFVGANSFSSALAMDKVISKILFQKAGLNTPNFQYFTENNYHQIRKTIHQKFSFPFFVKPCSLGSSIGISKVKNEQELKPALDSAFQNDSKILVEKAIKAREIEISVMGNREIKVSSPGELIPNNEFYNYADKYLENKTTFIIPAKLDPEIETKIKNMAEQAYLALFLNGMSRIDFLLENKTNQVYLNEINTIPGFTEISMFPKLWEIEGISFSDLITRLIEYGFEYYKDQNHMYGTGMPVTYKKSINK